MQTLMYPLLILNNLTFSHSDVSSPPSSFHKESIAHTAVEPSISHPFPLHPQR